MDKYIFLHVNNRFVRNILLKSIAKAGIGVMEIMDSDDLTMKLDAWDSIVLCYEIVDDNNLVVDDVVGRIRVSIDSVLLCL